MSATTARAAFTAALASCVLAACGADATDRGEAPPPPPEEWGGVIGEYARAADTVSLLEDEGHLALLHWGGAPSALSPAGAGSFQAEDGTVVAVDASSGAERPRSITVGDSTFGRLHLGADDGGTFRITPLRPPDELRAEALAASPPEETGDFRPSELVELVALDSTIHLDIRYATTNNFMGEVFYSEPRAFLQAPAAEALVRAHSKLREQGYGLLIHDGYRPWYVTKMFWEATPPALRVFVADPATGSRHNRGCAVDLTLYDLATGEPVEMTGGYDEMSPRSYPDYPGGTSRQRWHRALLREAMEAEGFTVYEAEWWHFDYRDWRAYRIGNQRFEELGVGDAAAAASDPSAPGPSAAQGATQVVRAGRVLDGRGGMLGARDIVVRDGEIVEVVAAGQGRGDVVHDLSAYTLLPDLIDTHVHLGWYFDDDGRLAQRTEMSDRVIHAAENAYRMLEAGVTTVQSLGGAEDGPVRDAFERGVLPGPRVLTSLGSVSGETGDEAALREAVRRFAEAGADVIKIFASESIRTGGAPTMTQGQLDAACAEAAARGLRAVVHAHGPESADRASSAGCTSIEHGALLDRQTLEQLADRGTYYDPNIHLIFQNYFDNEDRYVGIGSYTAEGFEQMRAAVPRALEAFRTALDVPGLQVVFGTDAVAGAHGRNVEEIVYRVRVGGQDPMDAVVSATSRSAASLGLGDRIGTVAVGHAADLVAVEGEPDSEIEALQRVRWVMVRGRAVIGG